MEGRKLTPITLNDLRPLFLWYLLLLCHLEYGNRILRAARVVWDRKAAAGFDRGFVALLWLVCSSRHPDVIMSTRRGRSAMRGSNRCTLTRQSFRVTRRGRRGRVEEVTSCGVPWVPKLDGRTRRQERRYLTLRLCCSRGLPPAIEKRPNLDAVAASTHHRHLHARMSEKSTYS